MHLTSADALSFNKEEVNGHSSERFDLRAVYCSSDARDRGGEGKTTFAGYVFGGRVRLGRSVDSRARLFGAEVVARVGSQRLFDPRNLACPPRQSRER